MPNLSNLTFNLLDGGLSRQPTTTEGVSALILPHQVDAHPAGVYQVTNLPAAESLGFTVTADISDGVSLYLHIADFFRQNPNGRLYIATQGDEASPDKDTVVQLIEDVRQESNGAVYQYGVIAGLTGSAAIDASTDATAGIGNYISDIQNKLNEMQAAKSPALCLIEVADYWPTGDAAPSTNMPTTNDDTLHVGLVVGKDNRLQDYESNPGAPTWNGANIGAALGRLANLQVHQSTGARGIQANNLSVGNEFQQLFFSGDEPLKGKTRQTLNAQTAGDHVIYFWRPEGQPGVYMTAAWSLATETSDFVYLSRYRTMAKAIRLANTALNPFVGGEVPVDSDTGYPAPGYRGSVEQAVEAALRPMLAAGELSDYAAVVPEEQNVLSTDTVNVQINLVPVGLARTITVDIGFTSTINQ